MNRTLHFSWSHIIAFLALIVTSYFSFVGFTYLTGGDFLFALGGMLVTDLLFILFFIGAQQMKASGEKMHRKIIWERIFVFGSPVVFIAGMIAMAHVWTVKSQSETIEQTFTESINSGRQLFTDYEDYANARIEAYNNGLTRIIDRRKADKKTFLDAGFVENKMAIQKENMVETLRLQLLSQNYDSLRTVANQWIDEASQGASVWNVFLIGNTREIKSALAGWEAQLSGYADKKMSNEELTGDPLPFSSDSTLKATAGIDTLTATFSQRHFPTLTAILFGVILYLMLLFPYLIQERHTKNVNRLSGSEGSAAAPLSSLLRKIGGSSSVWNADLAEILREDPRYPTF